MPLASGAARSCSATASRARSASWRAEIRRPKKFAAISGSWCASSRMNASALGSTSPKPLSLSAMSANSRW
ncbi:MAG: hypothetical protein U5K43_09410 [Halofilum sp. (in: g-proteobacteria)]|nr:hypothetical protein [Halofilum sp. (in: g-proteobacteria)]